MVDSLRVNGDVLSNNDSLVVEFTSGKGEQGCTLYTSAVSTLLGDVYRVCAVDANRPVETDLHYYFGVQPGRGLNEFRRNDRFRKEYDSLRGNQRRSLFKSLTTETRKLNVELISGFGEDFNPNRRLTPKEHEALWNNIKYLRDSGAFDYVMVNLPKGDDPYSTLPYANNADILFLVVKPLFPSIKRTHTFVGELLAKKYHDEFGTNPAMLMQIKSLRDDAANLLKKLETVSDGKESVQNYIKLCRDIFENIDYDRSVGERIAEIDRTLRKPYESGPSYSDRYNEMLRSLGLNVVMTAVPSEMPIGEAKEMLADFSKKIETEYRITASPIALVTYDPSVVRAVNMNRAYFDETEKEENGSDKNSNNERRGSVVDINPRSGVSYASYAIAKKIVEARNYSHETCRSAVDAMKKGSDIAWGFLANRAHPVIIHETNNVYLRNIKSRSKAGVKESA